jgi:hypothetical protein
MSTPIQQDALFGYLDCQLSILLRGLEETCQLHMDAEGSTTVWPSGRHLAELDSIVIALAIMERKKVPTPDWTAYKWVNKRWQRYHLVSRVEKLVRRARERLQEENEIDWKIAWPRQLNPDRFRREAFLEWIAGLGNSDFLDVIDIVYDPDPEVWEGESYSLPHRIVNAVGATRLVIAEKRKQKQGAKRAKKYRDRLKARENRRKNGTQCRKFHAKKA